MRLKLLVSALVTGLLGLGALAHAVEGKKALDSFSELNVNGSIDVKVDCAKGSVTELRGSTDLLDLITAAVTGGKLVLDSTRSLPPEKEVQVTASELKVIRVTSSADVTVENYAGDHLRIEILGSGDVTVQGQADSVEVRLGGSGDVRLRELKVRAADVTVAGSGDVYVGPADELKISLMGSGDVHYSGSPKLTKNILGSGDVVQD